MTLIADRQRGARTEDDFRRVIAASPVADFLGANGVSDAEAKIVAASLKQSAGLMVNYLYDLGRIEQCHDRFVRGRVVHSRALSALL